MPWGKIPLYSLFKILIIAWPKNFKDKYWIRILRKSVGCHACLHLWISRFKKVFTSMWQTAYVIPFSNVDYIAFFIETNWRGIWRTFANRWNIKGNSRRTYLTKAGASMPKASCEWKTRSIHTRWTQHGLWRYWCLNNTNSQGFGQSFSLLHLVRSGLRFSQ